MSEAIKPKCIKVSCNNVAAPFYLTCKSHSHEEDNVADVKALFHTVNGPIARNAYANDYVEALCTEVT